MLNITRLNIVPAFAKKKVKQAACGDYHTIVLTEDNLVFQMGGALQKDKSERKNMKNVNLPQPVNQLFGKDICYVDCGDFHSVALTSNGDLYTWGGGSQSYNKGQCGHGHTNAMDNPEVIKYFAKKRIIKVACGGFHTLALTSGNELYGFGSGVYGECGYGELLDTNKPKLVKFPTEQLNNQN